jgi:lipoyl(octanoyl) transferase
MRVQDLGLIDYRTAWQRQEEIHAQVLTGGDETLLLLEHPSVITFGRRTADAQRNLLAPPDALARLSVDVVESDRGGDITLHAPGQLVAYPILRLLDHRLSVGAYVQRLEDTVIATLADYDVPAFKDPTAIGVWVESLEFRGQSLGGIGSGPSCLASNLSPLTSPTAKLCALGVRIKRGVSLHGIALNLSTDLTLFNLINPCGLGRPVTSLAQLLGDVAPTMPHLKQTFARQFLRAFA